MTIRGISEISEAFALAVPGIGALSANILRLNACVLLFTRVTSRIHAVAGFVSVIDMVIGLTGLNLHNLQAHKLHPKAQV